jgi:hypothetical protein
MHVRLPVHVCVCVFVCLCVYIHCKGGSEKTFQYSSRNALFILYCHALNGIYWTQREMSWMIFTERKVGNEVEGINGEIND